MTLMFRAPKRNHKLGPPSNSLDVFSNDFGLIVSAPAASEGAPLKKRKIETINLERLYNHFNSLKLAYLYGGDEYFATQMGKTKPPEGSFNNFISQLEIDLNEEDTFSFFDAAFRFYFEATTLHYRNSNPTFTDCLSFLKARASWLSNCNLAISGFKNILKEFNFLRNENIEQKPREKMTEVLNQLTRLFNFFRDVKRMKLHSTVLKGLGEDLKIIFAINGGKQLIPGWIETQEREILPYLPKCNSRNRNRIFHFGYSSSENELSEDSTAEIEPFNLQ
ncbi:Dot/Icm T4SS effector CoxDFB3 [Coxiella burnetii]|uniref:Uncharacterized protein n=1 Tax=Coxiella burnetii (strain Dugway 5J108-111) TaxID=434922 RepID=A9KBP5_COXBN|nr:Dot/Icm T4SS effector CoxDFB3 [Coxiella burnetii]ABS77146.2 hypothetical protein CBUD_0588 [Coxiella burnetii Dugway 5J108-111]BBL36586.1 hypothetical protein; frameshifted ORF [Coxiella burnetii]